MVGLRVEPDDLTRKAAELAAPLPAVPGLPLPADGLQIAADALGLVTASAQKLSAHIASGEAEAMRLSQSFIAAAAAYRQVDERASAALSNGEAAPGIDPVAPTPNWTPSLPLPLDPPAGPRPTATFVKVEEAASLLQQSDQGASLDAFAASWRSYATHLEARAAAFEPSGVDWESPAAARAFDALRAHREWLLEIAEEVRKLADQAGVLGDAHRNALAKHPTLAEVLDVLNKIVTDPDNREHWIELYKLLQRHCDATLEEYANEVNVEGVDPPKAPDGGADMPAVSENGQPPEPEEEQPGSEKPQQPEAREESSPSGGSPSSGSPSGGSPSGGSSGGSGSGGGLPSGGLPSGTDPSEGFPMPADPRLQPSAAESGGGGGGAGGGAGGGGVSPMPLGPAVGGVAAGTSPTAGGTPGVAAPAAAASGGMVGGMGGIAPMHGAGAQGGKEKRRTPGLAPDEDIYTEDRPWTESVIGKLPRRGGGGEST